MAETKLMCIVTPNATSDLSPRHWFQHSGDKVSPIMIPMQKTARDFLPSDNDENIEMETRSDCRCSPDCQSECRCFSLEAETTTTLLPESTEEEDSVSMSSFGSDDNTALVIERNDKENVVCPTLSVCLSVGWSTRLPACLSICSSVYPSVCLFVCLSAYLSVCSSICPSMNFVFLIGTEKPILVVTQ